MPSCGNGGEGSKGSCSVAGADAGHALRSDESESSHLPLVEAEGGVQGGVHESALQTGSQTGAPADDEGMGLELDAGPYVPSFPAVRDVSLSGTYT